MENVFNPTLHRVVAVVSDTSRADHGSHVHVSLGELMRDGLQIVMSEPEQAAPIDPQPVMQAIAQVLSERDAQMAMHDRRIRALEAKIDSLLNIVTEEPAP